MLTAPNSIKTDPKVPNEKYFIEADTPPYVLLMVANIYRLRLNPSRHISNKIKSVVRFVRTAQPKHTAVIPTITKFNPLTLLVILELLNNSSENREMMPKTTNS